MSKLRENPNRLGSGKAYLDSFTLPIYSFIIMASCLFVSETYINLVNLLCINCINFNITSYEVLFFIGLLIGYILPRPNFRKRQDTSPSNE